MRKQHSDIASAEPLMTRAQQNEGGSVHMAKVVRGNIMAINNGLNTIQMDANLRRVLHLKRTHSEEFRRRKKWCQICTPQTSWKWSQTAVTLPLYVNERCSLWASTWFISGILLRTRKIYYAEGQLRAWDSQENSVVLMKLPCYAHDEHTGSRHDTFGLPETGGA